MGVIEQAEINEESPEKRLRLPLLLFYIHTQPPPSI